MATADLSWLEFAPGLTAQVSWLEFSTPPPSTTAAVSWLQFEPPAGTATASVSWLEFGAPAAPAIYTLTAEAGAYTMTWAGSVGQVVMDAGPGSYLMGAEEATLSVSAPVDTTALDVWNYIMPNGLTAAQVFCELHKIHGLTAGAPLVVASGTRTAGDISQTITDSAGVVTVTRQ